MSFIQKYLNKLKLLTLAGLAIGLAACAVPATQALAASSPSAGLAITIQGPGGSKTDAPTTKKACLAAGGIWANQAPPSAPPRYTCTGYKGAPGMGTKENTPHDPALDAHVCGDKDCPIVTKYLNPAIRLLAALVGIAVVIAVIVGGIEFASAAGDPQKVARGKQHIINALIGLIAFIFFYAFMNFVVPGGIG